MSYGNVYVAQISLGANPVAAIKALKEAESYDGPSLVICYAPCQEQGIRGGLGNAMVQEKMAVDCGYFLTYTWDPRLAEKGESPLKMGAKSKNPDFSKIKD